jgi:stringent starvation protein B
MSVRLQMHRYFAKANISYSGPRMDNGKAVLNTSTGATRQLSIWSDGIKVRDRLDSVAANTHL